MQVALLRIVTLEKHRRSLLPVKSSAHAYCAFCKIGGVGSAESLAADSFKFIASFTEATACDAAARVINLFVILTLLYNESNKV